jgi:lipoyl(octanoyl) transferase
LENFREGILIRWINLGQIDYRVALELQQKLREQVIRNRVGWFLACEHNPVITYGRLAAKENLLVSETYLRDLNIQLVETNRGGDFTYHGPGMLMGYFIVDLRLLKLDCVSFLRELEEIIISTLASFFVEAFRVQNYTGVWCKVQGQLKKICSIGIHVSKGVTNHGFCLNVERKPPDGLSMINPCGLPRTHYVFMDELIPSSDAKTALFPAVEKAVTDKVRAWYCNLVERE